MLLTRRKTFTAAVAILGASTAGVLAFAQRPNESAKPAPLPVQAGTSIPVLRPGMSLLEARIETAREIVTKDMERLQHMGAIGSDVLDQIPVWSRRLMEDRSRLAATPAERLTAIRDHRKRMIVLERLIGKVAVAGQGRVSDALKARYYRMEADQFLTEAGADPAKEPPVAESQGDAASARPAPPPASR